MQLLRIGTTRNYTLSYTEETTPHEVYLSKGKTLIKQGKIESRFTLQRDFAEVSDRLRARTEASEREKNQRHVIALESASTRGECVKNGSEKGLNP